MIIIAAVFLTVLTKLASDFYFLIEQYGNDRLDFGVFQIMPAIGNCIGIVAVYYFHHACLTI